jgi:CheY-like chemotaxis protein
MKHKKILLVSDDAAEIQNVERELSRSCVDCTVHIARNSMEALSILMGCSSPMLENFTKTGKVQPDLIFVDMDNEETNIADLLGIMQKYYSLQKIKVFAFGNNPDSLSESQKSRVSGWMNKPFNLDNQLENNEIRSHLLPAKALLPFLIPFRKLGRTSKYVQSAAGTKVIVLSTGAASLKAAAIFVAISAGFLAWPAEQENYERVANMPPATEISVSETVKPAEKENSAEFEPLKAAEITANKPEHTKPSVHVSRAKKTKPAIETPFKQVVSQPVKHYKIFVQEELDSSAVTEN